MPTRKTIHRVKMPQLICLSTVMAHLKADYQVGMQFVTIRLPKALVAKGTSTLRPAHADVESLLLTNAA